MMDKRNDVLKALRGELIEAIDEKVKLSEKRFFKEEVTLLGVGSAAVGKLSKKYFDDLKGLSKVEVFSLCENLLSSGYIEEAFIAYDWSYRVHAHYQPEDFRIFEHWVSTYVSNWAECDTLCNHTIGTFVEKYPQFISDLKRWTSSENRWVKRAAAVTLIIPARKGLFLTDVFEIADSLLMDKDDLVQKGYGWMLKEASKAHLEEVFDYVIRHKSNMPRTALRYAIEKMPPELRQQAMEKG